MSLKDYAEIVKSWLTVDTDTADRVDQEFLSSETVQYEWITVQAEQERVRCDICGRLMDIQKMPELMAHVGSHNEQGAAEVDPTATPGNTYDISVEEHELENSDAQEPWEI